MKTMKKLMVLVLAIAMVLGTSVMTSFAASIEVKDVLDGETYTAYKILNYKDNGKTGDDRKVSYYLTSAQYTSIGSVLEAAGFAFTASSDGTQYTVNNADTVDVSAVASYLGSHTADLGNALGKKTATGANEEANFTDLEKGYYFVTSTAGTLCALHEDTQIAKVVEKNTIPSVDKKEKTTGDSYVDGPVDAKIGDTVSYQITVTDGIGTNAPITLKDTLSDGLDYTVGSIKINGTAVADDANTDNWQVAVSGRVITIVLKAAYVASLDTGDNVVITYDAKINKDAVVDNAEANGNTVELDYSKQHTEDHTYVQTYDFQVYKTDGTEFLDGAEFKLYDAATGGNQILLSSDATGYYVDAAGSADTTIDINSAEGCNVRGLAPGDYYLEETVVPDGYNKLSGRKKVTVTTDQTAAVEITVVNEAGTELPSTGGMGTTILYIMGGALVVVCGIMLVAKKRTSNK